jgi:hypothetical protein
MIKTTETKKRVTVTSTLFDDMKEFMYGANNAISLSGRNRYYAFGPDNPLNQYSDKKTAIEYNTRLAIANVVMMYKSWHQGVGECNDFMDNKAKDPNMVYKAVVPGVVLESEE